MNNFLLKNVLVIFVISFIAFQSCNKDTNFTEVKKADPTEQKILNFKEKIESVKNGNKSNETMSIEDAVWNIEAALNYTYNDFEATELISVDTIRIPVNISNNGEINLNDVISAYNELESSLTDFVGVNSLNLADIEIVESTNKSEGSEIKMTTIVKSTFPISWFFGETDYWKAFWGGKCGPYSGYTDRNARTQLTRKASYSLAYPANGYITDINTVVFFPDGNNYQDYLFYQSGHNNTMSFSQACLNPDELNYWLGKFKQLAIDYKPEDKEIAGYFMNWDGYNVVDGPWYYTHVAEISYGIFHHDNTIEN